jgi:hypothetical protein
MNRNGRKGGNPGNMGNRTRGEQHHRAKLTDAQVAKIRRMYRPRVVSMPILAQEFGVSVSCVKHILYGETRT